MENKRVLVQFALASFAVRTETAKSAMGEQRESELNCGLQVLRACGALRAGRPRSQYWFDRDQVRHYDRASPTERRVGRLLKEADVAPIKRPVEVWPIRWSALVVLVCVLIGVSAAPAQGKLAGRTEVLSASSGPKVLGTDSLMMANLTEQKDPPASFYEALRKALKKRKTSLEGICPQQDLVSRRILEEYGAIFIATRKVTTPPVCVFTSEKQVTKFQDEADYITEFVSYADIELQPEAMKALLKARGEALKEGLDISPRDGAEAARRSFEDSLKLWDTRFLPALDHWQAQGRLTQEQVTRLKNLPLRAQVAEVLELEKTGIYFSKDLSKSILYSIAAPGASQHIAMLAFDVNEFANSRVRELLAKHGWFQTVLSDLPHFTFLGLKEKELPKNGLRSVEVDGQMFWIPNISATESSR